MPHINILGTFILIILGYLIGSISPAIIISKEMFKTDIRQHYSKNAGAANSTRLMGKKWGTIIVFLDGFKPIITVLVAWGFTFIKISNPEFQDLFAGSYIYFSGLAAVIGHCWPVYFGFRGGKGAASALGLMLVINPIYFIVALVSWWLMLYLWRMASLSSVLMIGFPFVLSWIPNIPFNAYIWPHDQQYYIINIIIFLAWLIVVLCHSKNLVRIIRGTERKVTIFDRKK